MIPHIVKGRGISGAIKYVLSEGFAEEKAEGTSNDNRERGRYKTLAEGEQTRVTILGGQNFGFDIDGSERLDLARRVMEWQGLPENQGSKTRTQDLDCLHASLSWEPGYKPDAKEMMEAGTEFLKSIGLEKARAVFVAHDDTDHAHIHVVASRIDPETGKTLRVDYDQAAAQKWALDWEKAHGQEREGGKDLHALRDAVEARDVGAVLSHMTRDRSTFEVWQLNRALQYGGLDRGEARDEFRAAILGDKNTIGLRDAAEGQVTRFTTRQVLAEEMTVLRTADRLAHDRGHGLTETQTAAVGAAFTLQPEQTAALDHLAGPEGLAILWGEAGTGKSHTLNAARVAYSDAGRDVIGLSHTNDVVQQMRGDGFKAATITSELNALDKGERAWTRKTVVIVDEAAMVSTAALGRLMLAAADAGAKLIIAGDDAQLSSIERGGLFETLRQNHGAAILSDVQRVKTVEQRTAFNQMHKGEFVEALQTFDKAGGLHWRNKQSDALKDMAERYTADVAADPDKKRFMFAYTNVDVRDLNSQARAMHKERGDLGRDHELQTKHGLQEFAEGDRIQFTANGRTQREKNAGLTNGRVGTVEGIAYDERDRARVTVALDGKSGVEPQRVTFTVGDNDKAGEFNSFKLGYAGTVYRGQGRTLDQTYVAYTKHMRASAAYVALTRHREQVHIFAARETVKDLDAMAKAMSRPEGKRAATAYVLDDASALRLDFSDMGRETAAAERPEVQSSRGLDRAQAAREAMRLNDPAQRQEAAQQQARQEAARSTGQSPEAVTGPPQPAETAKAEVRPLTAKEQFEADLKAFTVAEREQRKAAVQELTRMFGREINEEEGKEITRDRGGGQSL